MSGRFGGRASPHSAGSLGLDANKTGNDAFTPAMKGRIAAGYRGSDPAEQGAIAAYLDDLEREKKRKSGRTT